MALYDVTFIGVTHALKCIAESVCTIRFVIIQAIIGQDIEMKTQLDNPAKMKLLLSFALLICLRNIFLYCELSQLKHDVLGQILMY